MSRSTNIQTDVSVLLYKWRLYLLQVNGLKIKMNLWLSQGDDDFTMPIILWMWTQWVVQVNSLVEKAFFDYEIKLSRFLSFGTLAVKTNNEKNHDCLKYIWIDF